MMLANVNNLENLLAVELIGLGSHLVSMRRDENLTLIDGQNIFQASPDFTD